MRLLVIGAQGQVALSLAELAEDGLEIVTAGRPEADLAQPAGLVGLIERVMPHAVINAAAHTAVDLAESQEAEARAINATGPGVLAELCARKGLPLVHLSTDYVYSGDKPTPYFETDPTGPTGAYARTKLEGEHLVLAAHPDAVVMRTAWVYSPFGKNFVKTMLRLAETRDEVGVVSDQFGCPTYAPHIAEACVEAARKLLADPKTYGGVYHYSGLGDTSWAGFAAEIFAQAQQRGQKGARVKPIATADYPTPAKRPGNSRLDCSKITARLGIVPKSWPSALSTCMDRLMS
jgi:dTDP-4-dehydrorhamnose reductase